jgi:hypothetical protein
MRATSKSEIISKPKMIVAMNHKPLIIKEKIMTTTKDERSRNVAKMLANFAQEGQVPDAEDEALLQRYIEGTATLADLYEHASEYAFAAQESKRLQHTREEFITPFELDLEGFDASMKAYDEEQKRKTLANIGISSEQRRRQEAVDFAKASVGLSGFTISEETKRNSARFVAGEITMEEYLAIRRG